MPRRVWLPVLLVALAIVASAVVLARAGERVLAVAGVLIGAAGVLVAIAAYLWPRAAGGDPAEAAVVALARAQTKQWTVEQVARRVRDPYPLPVRWRVSARAAAVMASWASVRGVPGGGPVPLEGSFADVAQVFTGADSPRRLVVLGEPGAGKSMLVLHLTVELLRLRGPAEPVPVLLPVAGWDPAQELDDWIARRLAADNRVLARLVRTPDGTWRSLAHELVAAGRVLPVLDGLDEITPAWQAAALGQVAAAAGVGRQFVLTSRTAAYEAAVAAGGPLSGAAVIEIEPLDPSDVGRYLLAGTDQPTPRWDAVITHLGTRTASPLRQALSTPLMAWLARAVYQHRGTDPADLLTAPWAGDQAGIEEHLLDQLIPAVYTTATGGHRRRTAAEADRARRYLTWLAQHLHRRHTYDLAWWHLHHTIPRPLLSLAVELARGLAFGFGFGLMFGLLGWLVGGLGFGFGFGLVVGLMFGLLGVVVAGAKVFAPHRATLSRVKPSVLAAWLMVWLVVWLTVGLVVWLAGGLVVWLTVGLVGGLAVGLAGGLQAGLGPGVDDDQRAITPISLLAADRTVGLVSGLLGWLVGGLVVGLAGGPVVGLAGALSVGLVGGLGFGLAFAFATAWFRFCVARAVLAVRGRTPLRLMTFLGEAHDRGVLRQVGGVYQFRHSRLQIQLAEPARYQRTQSGV